MREWGAREAADAVARLACPGLAGCFCKGQMPGGGPLAAAGLSLAVYRCSL